MSEKTCLTCPAWFRLNDADDRHPIDGQCRANPPTSHLLPTRTMQGEGLALHGFFPPIQSDNWCVQHPERYNDMNPPVPLAWDKDNGFNRAPTLEEAMAFKPGEEGDAARQALIDKANCEECEE